MKFGSRALFGQKSTTPSARSCGLCTTRWRKISPRGCGRSAAIFLGVHQPHLDPLMEGVHITRSRRKSIELSIDDNLQIAVKAPCGSLIEPLITLSPKRRTGSADKKPPRPPTYRHIPLNGSGSGSAAPPSQGGTAAPGGLLQPNSERNPHRHQDNKCQKALWLLQREEQHLPFPST